MSSLVDSLKNASDLLHLSQRKLPLSLDGLTDAEAASTLLDKPQDHGKVYDLIDEIQGAIHRGEPIDLDEDTYVRRSPAGRPRIQTETSRCSLTMLILRISAPP